MVERTIRGRPATECDMKEARAVEQAQCDAYSIQQHCWDDAAAAAAVACYQCPQTLEHRLQTWPATQQRQQRRRCRRLAIFCTTVRSATGHSVVRSAAGDPRRLLSLVTRDVAPNSSSSSSSRSSCRTVCCRPATNLSTCVTESLCRRKAKRSCLRSMPSVRRIRWFSPSDLIYTALHIIGYAVLVCRYETAHSLIRWFVDVLQRLLQRVFYDVCKR